MTTNLYTLQQFYYSRYRAYRRDMDGDTFARPLSFLEWLLRELWYSECSDVDNRAALVAVLAERTRDDGL